MKVNKAVEQTIIHSWQTNAAPWAKAIQQDQIASRTQVTNQAILDAVLAFKPATLIDIGCGEGWLCRALQSEGTSTLGVDVVSELIEIARALSPGDYKCVSYEQLANGVIPDKFDLAVCNFSLFGKDSVEGLFKLIPSLLCPGGHFVVQTLHPETAAGSEEVEDGWRESSWAGFSDEFADPAPWYYRNMDSWIDLFRSNGFEEVTTLEPKNQNNEPVSLILSGKSTTYQG